MENVEKELATKTNLIEKNQTTKAGPDWLLKKTRTVLF